MALGTPSAARSARRASVHRPRWAVRRACLASRRHLATLRAQHGEVLGADGGKVTWRKNNNTVVFVPEPSEPESGGTFCITVRKSH